MKHQSIVFRTFQLWAPAQTAGILLCCLAVTQAASAAETISGRVLNAATGFGMVGFDLDVFDTDGQPVKVTGALSGANGAYTITMPAPGTYFLRADATLDSAFADQFYSGQFLKSTATPVTVGSGANVTGIDFHLSPGREIRGRVTAGGTPLADIDIDVYEALSGEFLSGYPGVTAADGTYAVGALPPGSYIVRAQPDAALGQFYIQSYYSGGTNLTSATPVVVGGTMVSGIDFDVAPGGSISGRVTAQGGGQVLEGLDLDVFDAGGARLPFNAITDTNGHYFMGPMPAGQYLLRVDPPADGGHARQYYAGASTLATAAPITVTTGADRANIDFALGPAGHITGTMRDAVTHEPLEGVDLDVFDSLGARLDISARTQPDGSYDLGPLPAGDYLVRADPALDMFHARTYHPDTHFQSEASPVTVVAGLATAGIDFSLAAAGAIAGTMTAAVGGTPIGGVDLDVFRASDTNRLDITAATAADGSYVLGPLPEGSYFVRADPRADSGWAVEFHPNLPDVSGAVPVPVTAGQTTQPIDFELDGAGWIAGSITSATAQPLPNIDLDVFDAATDLRVPFSAKTDAAGAFLLGPLRPGAYKVRVDPDPSLGYALEYYDAQTTRLAATPITVTAGTGSEGVNLVLEPSAVLSGRILSAETGQAVPNLDLDLLQAADQARMDQTIRTDAAGDFAITDVPAGQYILRADPDPLVQPYVRTYYGQTTDPLAATVITVASGETRTGLDISIFSPVPPSVVFLAPADQSQIIVPATVDLVAEASSTIATVAQVDFYEGDQLLAALVAPPYTVSVALTTAGARSFSAVATDSIGLVSAPAAVTVHVVNNQAPTVTLTAPVDGTSVIAPADFTLSATASDTDGSVVKVEFFNGGTKLGESLTAPYALAWPGVAAGDYTLMVVATDDRGLKTTSAPVTVHVVNNQAPTVALTAPVNGTSFFAPADITLAATASDTDGSVVNVEFFNGGTKLGESLTAPYALAWPGVAAGDYTLTAVATDDRGLQTTSASITVHVVNNQAPTVTLNLTLGGDGRTHIHFETANGWTYFLEAASSPDAQIWDVVGEVAGNGQPAVLEEIPPATNARFYRVRAE